MNEELIDALTWVLLRQQEMSNTHDNLQSAEMHDKIATVIGSFESWAARGVPTDKSTAEICTGTATLTGISGSIETRQDMPGFTLTSHPHSRPSVQQILLSSHVVHAKAEHSWLDCVMGFLVLMTLGSQWLKRFSHQLWQIWDVASAF